MTFKVAPRETITKCSSYDNKFRTYPEELKLKAVRAEKARIDAQESEAARYERLLMTRMLKGDFFVQKDKSEAVAAISKLFAMIFLFPPFFMFFAFPKWTFTVVIPKIYETVDEAITVVFVRLKRISAWTGNVFGTTAKKIVRKLKSKIPVVSNPFKGTFKNLKESISKKIENIVKPFTQIKISNPFRKLIDKYKTPIVQKLDVAMTYYKALTDGIEKGVMNLQIKMDNFVNFFKASPPPMRAYGQKDPVPVWKEKLDAISDFVKSVAKQAVHIAMNPVEFAKAKIEPFINWVYPVFPFFKEQGVSLAQYSTRKVTEAIERVQEYAKIIMDKTSYIVNKIAIAAYTRAEAFVTYLSRPVYKMSSKAAKKFVQVKSWFKDRVSAVSNSMAKGFNQFKGQAKKAAKYITAKIKTIPEKAIAFVKGLSNIGYHLFKALQTLFIFFKVTFKIAFQYIGEKANRVLKLS